MSCPSEIGATGVVTDGKRPGAVVRFGGTEGPLADQKAVVRHTYLIAPVVTLIRLRTLRGFPMLGSGNSGSLINAAYRFRELPYSDNSLPLTDDVLPWGAPDTMPRRKLLPARPIDQVTVHPYSGGEP